MGKQDLRSLIELRARRAALVHSVLVAAGTRIVEGAPLALFGCLVSFDPAPSIAPSGRSLGAPASGVIVRCHVSDGEAVDQGATLFTMLVGDDVHSGFGVDVVRADG
jgi:hypothetical protein